MGHPFGFIAMEMLSYRSLRKTQKALNFGTILKPRLSTARDL
jgi:hypothetical protein